MLVAVIESHEPDCNSQVGIEDCLHIEFEYNKSKCVAV